MLTLIREGLPNVLRAVAPLIGVACLLQFAFVGAPAELFLQFVVGALLVVAGMVLLFAGIDIGILPMGRFIGAELPRKGSLTLILSVAFSVGFATTLAEPDVLVLAGQAEWASQGNLSKPLLVCVIAGGVGVFAALGLLRMAYGFSMAFLLAGVYSLAILLSLVLPARLLPLAFDAGSVTTGLLTAPVLLALALGFNSVLAQRSTISDSFGLLGLASVGPIIAVLLLGVLL